MKSYEKGNCVVQCHFTLKAVQSDQPMPIHHQTIHIHPLAPQKPGEGKPCNGCGVCCLSEPCPLGVLLSRRRLGPCEALRWSEGDLLYRCGAISEPKDVLSQAMPGWLRPLAIGLSPLMARLASRWVAAGQGCDSTLEVASTTRSMQSTFNSPINSPALADLPARHHPLPPHRHDESNSAS